MNKKLIVFDLDGVLFNSIKLVNDFFMKAFPDMTQEKMNEILCGNFHEELAKFKQNHKPIKETEEEHKKRVDTYVSQKKCTPLYDGIYELLDNLHKSGYTLTINTSAFEKNCLPLLEYSKIRHFFDFVATKEVSLSKVEKFKIIAEKYNILPKDMLFVTDTLGDLREASTAGVPTLAVTYGAHNAEFFKREHYQNLLAIVHSVQELGENIKKHLEI